MIFFGGKWLQVAVAEFLIHFHAEPGTIDRFQAPSHLATSGFGGNDEKSPLGVLKNLKGAVSDMR